MRCGRPPGSARAPCFWPQPCTTTRPRSSASPRPSSMARGRPTTRGSSPSVHVAPLTEQAISDSTGMLAWGDRRRCARTGGTRRRDRMLGCPGRSTRRVRGRAGRPSRAWCPRPGPGRRPACAAGGSTGGRGDGHPRQDDGPTPDPVAQCLRWGCAPHPSPPGELALAPSACGARFAPTSVSPRSGGCGGHGCAGSRSTW